ncbi:TonB-dependent receptor [Simiduia aestuariiviva]|uniref:Outer membrane receptor protein involved in Fe transport n=1 Tax=Simiduia aestuariiviva TaxID=1510459 RepID=A0A839UHW2_9GAMM|nr:TonB-dependent receptor [Simiduia aestuariiviva]MBB3167073.1 outer membrane receptor protein involved in Fe transport [Simiduia aestuariiviva]
MKFFYRKSGPCALLLSMIATLLNVHTATATELETVTVTATRSAQALSTLATSVAVIDEDELKRVSATHPSEALARVPGVWIARGNGQEHLTAIRSPVLTGAGSCGAFAITEEGVPVRATGFCNVNQLFDLNTEQAQQVDVLRGPSTVMFGSDAQHGVINVISQSPGDQRASMLGFETGANDYARIKVSHGSADEQQGFRLNLNAAHDGGFKDDAGFDQQKLTARYDYHTDDASTHTLLSINNLNQETAGYVVGTDAYRDPNRLRENPNPEAFRDAQSMRVQTRIAIGSGSGTRWLITPYARYNHMTFMMHFLPGTPVEENGHRSFGVQSALFSPINSDLHLTAGLDAESTDAWLSQTQAGGFSAFPAGKHYDYRVQGLMAAPFALLDAQLTEHTAATVGLRYETLHYDYHNKMISGDTAEDGSPCINGFTGAVGCRYSRPDDRSDRFGNLSSHVALLHHISANHTVFARYAQGKRAPQATEMYRLQNGQMNAHLDSESIHSNELGLRGQWAGLRYSVTAFHMRKDQVIFQSADRLNINGGKTEHQGFEYALNWQLNDHWQIALTGTLADHHYRTNVSAPGSDANIATQGNRVVSAPYSLQTLRLNWTPTTATHAELELLDMGRYYTNLENTHAYRGHRLAHLRVQHQLTRSLTLGARITNLTNTRYAERADYSAFSGDRYFIGEPRAAWISLTVYIE